MHPTPKGVTRACKIAVDIQVKIVAGLLSAAIAVAQDAAFPTAR
jgi:hypothetical protein